MTLEIHHDKICIHKMPSGAELDLNVLTFDSGTPGPITYIQSSVHGAELQGNIVIYEMMKHLKKNLFKGKVIFAPLANPFATNNRQGGHTQGRFNPLTGHNWNRNYIDLMKLKEEQVNFSLKTFIKKHLDTHWEKLKQEYKKAIYQMLTAHEKKLFLERGPRHNSFLNLQLQKLASEADIVLDLHTGPVATRYIYSAEYERDRVADLSFPFNLSIPNVFAGAMDEACFMPWVKLRAEMKVAGREIPIEFESYTVELGSEERISTEEGLVDANRLLHYLFLRGQLEDDVEFNKPEKQYWCLLSDYKTYYSEHGGLFEFDKVPGDLFKKGDVLGRYLLPSAITPELIENEIRPELIALKDGIVINHACTCGIGMGGELYQVMEEVKTF
jgi:predicted deacylase